MARKCFYSFHYVPDNWRVSTVRNIGAIEGNKPAADNDWESVTKGGDAAIKKWIADQMSGRTCTIVLVGSQTANRKWINHEIIKSWDDGKGVVGIYVHGIKDVNGNTTAKGLCCTNPVRDSSRESSVVAGLHEQADTADLQDPELASL